VVQEGADAVPPQEPQVDLLALLQICWALIFSPCPYLEAPWRQVLRQPLQVDQDLCHETFYSILVVLVVVRVAQPMRLV
jgi:hypothetical protein